MRNLLISLTCVAILATISLGWLFDTIYSQYQSDNQPITTIELVEEMGMDLATAINAAPNGEALLEYWPNSSQYHLSLYSVAETALPQALIQQLKQGEVVILETENTQLFHYYLKDKDQVLTA